MLIPVATSFVAHGLFAVPDALGDVMSLVTLGIIVVASVNSWLVGEQHNEPSAVEHGLLLLGVLHVPLGGEALALQEVQEERQDDEVQEEQHPLEESVAQGS
jgi:hypothetical protein